MNKKSTLRKYLWTVLITVFIFASVIFAQAQDIIQAPEGRLSVVEPIQDTIISTTEMLPEQPRFQGYIIQFQEEPVLVRKAALEKDIEKRESDLEASSPLYKYTIGLVDGARIAYSKARKGPRVESQREKILEEHRNALADIRARVPSITGYAVAEQDKKLPNEYTDVFNGISLDITPKEARKLKESPYVKEIYPNYEVNITLMDSIPLINADDVWQLDEDGNDCTTSGKTCLTGEGIKIGIIDTGVDYTHLDLGGSTIAEKDYQRITDSPINLMNDNQISNNWVYEQTFRINNNKIAYFSHNDIAISWKKNASFYVYDFNTGQTQVYPAYSENLTIFKLAYKDNKIAYFANNVDNQDEFEIYYYNLVTGEHKKISQDLRADAYSIGNIFISENKIIADFYNVNATIFGVGGTTQDPRARLIIYDITTDNYEDLNIEPGYTASLMIQVFGNKLVYNRISFSEEDVTKLVLYDLDTGTKTETYPPMLGSVLDFKNDLIIYADNMDDSNNYWKNYHLYNITSGESTPLIYSEQDQEGGGTPIKMQALAYMTPYHFNKAYIGNNAIFFSKSASDGSIMIYNKNNQQYGQLNHYMLSGAIGGEGDKICFLSRDMNIYCHNYNQRDSYPISQPIFNNKVIGGYDFINDDNDPLDDQGHGTHCAATAAGNGALKGVAPNADILAYKVLDYSGSGYASGIMSGIEKAVEDGADVISLSLGAFCWLYDGGENGGLYPDTCGPNDPQSQAIDNAVDSGVVAVVAAGNMGAAFENPERSIGSPGTARKAITIGATNKSDSLADFSSRGPVVWEDEQGNIQTMIKPDIVAPGVNICAAERSNFFQLMGVQSCLDNSHVFLSGTSMATPHIAGVVALLKQKNPDYSPLDIKNILMTNAINLSLPPNDQGSGRVNVIASLGGIIPNQEICSNTIDDDADGLIDMDDPGCENAEDDDEKDPATIQNPSSVDIKGILTVKIQKKEYDIWIDKKIVIDKSKIGIRAGTSLDLSKIWDNAGGYITTTPGDYRVYVDFNDSTNNDEVIESYEFNVTAICGNNICEEGEQETCPEDCAAKSSEQVCEDTGGTWRNCTLLKCPYSYFVANDCICPPSGEWGILKTEIKNKVREGCSCPAGTKWDSEKGCAELINAKNMSKYSTKEAFLISDNDWHDVLALVPIAVWTGNEECQRGYGTPENVCTYPALIYHKEETGFDADSIIYFMQQYSPDKITIIGNTPAELDNLLVAAPDLGAGLNSNQIQRISASDYFSYWESYDSLVYVQDNYELALMASAYASLINAPLIIQGTSSDTANVFSGKNVVCIGSVSPSGSSCAETYTLEQLQQKYVDETDTDKIILVNSNDLDIYHTDTTTYDKTGEQIPVEFNPEKSTGGIFQLYGKTSLAAPILASAKHELIISTSSTNYPDVDSFIETKITNPGFNPKYLTVIASPEGIEIRDPSADGFGWPSQSYDNIYADIDNDPFIELATGRIFGLTISDITSYIGRVLFFDELEYNSSDGVVYSADINDAGLSFASATSFKNKLIESNYHVEYYITNDSNYGNIPLDKYENMVVEGYYSHGGPFGFMRLNTQDLRTIKSISPSIILNIACLTCDYISAKNSGRTRYLFCSNLFRKGLMAYNGAVTTSNGLPEIGDPYYIWILMANENLSIGEAWLKLINIQPEMVGRYKRMRYATYTLIGDPTFRPIINEVPSLIMHENTVDGNQTIKYVIDAKNVDISKNNSGYPPFIFNPIFFDSGGYIGLDAALFSPRIIVPYNQNILLDENNPVDINIYIDNKLYLSCSEVDIVGGWGCNKARKLFFYSDKFPNENGLLSNYIINYDLKNNEKTYLFKWSLVFDNEYEYTNGFHDYKIELTFRKE